MLLYLKTNINALTNVFVALVSFQLGRIWNSSFNEFQAIDNYLNDSVYNLEQSLDVVDAPMDAVDDAVEENPPSQRNTPVPSITDKLVSRIVEKEREKGWLW
jgi:hypothetical protein